MTNKSRRRHRPELYIVLNMGWKPRDLIRRGVPVTTAYIYSSRFKNRIRQRIVEIMDAPVMSEEEYKKVMQNFHNYRKKKAA